MSKQNMSLEERLAVYPKLKEHVLGLLDVVESGIDLADEAEERTIEGVRELGHEVLEEWAHRREKAHSDAADADADMARHGKKNSTGRVRSEKSSWRSIRSFEQGTW
jgi:hypothetical protein